MLFLAPRVVTCRCARLLLRPTPSPPSAPRVVLRHLTGSEVATALRPFYFLVHPDLFGKYPREQRLNENALKTLKSYVDTLVSAAGRDKPNPARLTFFVKPRTAEEKERPNLRSVHILLKEPHIRPTVTAVLRSVNLPTGYVDNIPEEDGGVKGEVVWEEVGPRAGEGGHGGFSSTDKRQPFLNWFVANVEAGRSRLSQCEPIRLETVRLQDEICYKFGLTDILWDCDWETSHRRGAVESFKFLAASHPYIADIIQGKTVVFGRSSGVSLSGHIILYSGEVRHNWLDVIKNVPKNSDILEKLPLAEKTISQCLRYIEIVHRQYQPITLVEDYRTRLRKLVTGVNDFRSRKSFPDSWPEDMSEFKLCVESESSPLMLSPTGVFIAPASCPGFLLVDFITKGMDEARVRMRESESEVHYEQHVVTRCVNELGLIQLDKDDSITSNNMITCCNKLLREVGRLRHLTHGNHLMVTRFYSVTSDGIMCVPWDFTFGDMETDWGHQGVNKDVRRISPV